MTKKGEFGLVFSRIKCKDFGYYFSCASTSTIKGSRELARLLELVSEWEPDLLLEEVNLALNGGHYEEYYSVDGSFTDTIQIIPPNLVYNDFEIPLTDVKGVLEEWIEFIEDNRNKKY